MPGGFLSKGWFAHDQLISATPQNLWCIKHALCIEIYIVSDSIEADFYRGWLLSIMLVGLVEHIIRRGILFVVLKNPLWTTVENIFARRNFNKWCR